LFGQDVEHRGTSQVECLPHDVQVLPSERANTADVEPDGSLRPRIASLRRSDLRASGELRRFTTSLRARPLGLGSSNLTWLRLNRGSMTMAPTAT
jgi:hypothetical protein